MNRKHKEATASGLASPFIDGIGRPLPKNQIFKVVHLNKSSIDKYSKYVTTRKSVALPGEDVISRMSAELTSTQTKIGKVKQHDDGRKVLHMKKSSASLISSVVVVWLIRISPMPPSIVKLPLCP